MSSLVRNSYLGRLSSWTVVTLILVVSIGATRSLTTVNADEGCDSSEQVACIPLPTDTSLPPPQPGGTAGSAGGSVPNVAAVAVPAILCAQGACCGPLPIGVAGTQGGAPAAVPAPAPGGYCPYPTNSCYPPLPYAGALGASASSGAAISAVPVPGPIPQPYCSPYRGIYTTINLGNAADVRALRTLSADALRPYWRGGAFSDIASQITQLQLVGDYASPRLYSIQVQSATLDLLSSTANVRTLEHWLYEEHSQYDGSVVSSQDEWVTNRYTLSLQSYAWYITGDSISITGGPQPIPLPASGG
ncbi:MAG TPA: hypothetical protein VK821_03585 [Dehalococcoidia bacterium]|nr:hypothetical protein [Dehalococcoidia bacterium]